MNKNQFKHDEESKDPIFVLDIKILKQKYFIRECQYWTEIFHKINMRCLKQDI